MRDRTVIVPSPCRFKLIRIVYGRTYEIQNNTRHGHVPITLRNRHILKVSY